MTAYQSNLKACLDAIFPPATVCVEWPAMRDERGIYSPRLDVAVGPFATQQRYIHEYDTLLGTHFELLQTLYRRHLANVGEESNATMVNYDDVVKRNLNARCFLAIEVENRVDRKHLMGGAINAAALGRVGLAVAWNESNLEQFVRMRRYLLFLKEVEKNTFDTTNLLVLTATQLLEIVNEHVARGMRHQN